MGSGPVSNSHPTPSSVSGPRFNEPSEVSFDQPTMRVGRYRILSELGRGGMSNVYLAVARGPGGVNKLVVLKALLPDLSTEPYALAMFLDEARLAAQLNHPNVVQTYEVGTEGDRHVIVMEYLEGQSLSSTLRHAEKSGTPMPLGLYLRIIINALEGLHYAHELGAYDGTPLMLVHRDISPQNAFVTYDGQVKVLDFGIAKATSSSTHTATGVVKGKIAYMAPEQIIGDSIDRRADIYSVGCMLWAAATGTKLWKDTPDVHVMRRVINADIPTPQSANPGCDDELNRIVMKALATDPAHRYQTALELQHDVEQYAERRGVVVKQKDIARYVSELFGEKRAQLKSLVERQLTLLQTDESGVSRDLTPAPRTGRETFTGTQAAAPAPTAPSGSRRLVFAGVLLAVLLAGATFVFWPAPTARPLAEPTLPNANAAPGPAAPPTAAAPVRVSVKLQAQPAAASLFLDGEALPSNPTTKLLVVDGKAHVLRAEALGFSEATTEFSPTQDTTLELTLSRLAGTAATNTAAGPRHGTRAPRQTTSAGKPKASGAGTAPKADCESPFFLDKDGIRRVRPECR